MSVSPSSTLLIANVRPASQFFPHTLSVSLTVWTTSRPMDAEMLSAFTERLDHISPDGCGDAERFHSLPAAPLLSIPAQGQVAPVLHPRTTGLFIFEKYWSMIGMQSPLSPSVSQRCVHI